MYSNRVLENPRVLLPDSYLIYIIEIELLNSFTPLPQHPLNFEENNSFVCYDKISPEVLVFASYTMKDGFL